jgi:hypothetical protein
MVRVHHEDPEHRAHLPAWRIHALTRDFRLEDVWALPTPGGPDDFPRPVQGIAGGRQGDPHRFRTETMKTTTTLLDEVLSEFVVNVFSGWLRPDFLYRIARIAEDSA